MRYLRTSLRVAGVFATAVVVLLVCAVLVSQTSWFRDWLRRYAMREAAQFVDGQLIIGRVEGGLWGGVQLHDVRIDRGGETMVTLDRLEVEYRLVDFVREGVVIRRVALVAPVVHLRREGDGWNIASLLVPQPPSDPDAPRTAFRLDVVSLRDGRVTVNDPACPPPTAGCLPASLEQVRMDARVVSTAEEMVVELHEAALASSEPDLAVRRMAARLQMTDTALAVTDLEVQTVASALSGRAQVDGYDTAPDVDAALSAQPLAMREVARFAPQLADVTLAPTIDVTADGPLAAMRVTLDVRSAGGAVRADVVADVDAPTYGLRGVVDVEAVNLAAVLGDGMPATTVTATTSLDVSGADLPSLVGDVAVEATRLEGLGYTAEALQAEARLDAGVAHVKGDVRAYGVAASTAGTVDYAQAEAGVVAFDLRGDVRDLDIRRLPAALGAPALASNIALDYQVAGTPDALQARAQLRRSTVDTLVIDAGTTVQVHRTGTRLGYDLAGGVRQLDIERLGQIFGVEALDAPAYASDVQATFSVVGEGTDIATAQATARIDIVDSTIGGAQVPQLRVDATATRGAVDATVVGRVDDLRPEVFTGRADLAGRVSADIDAAVSVPDVSAEIVPAALTGRVRVALDPSEIGGLQLEASQVEAQIADGVVDVTRVFLDASAITLLAQGPVALTETGMSRLTYDVDVHDAGALASLAGQPGVAGRARLQGVLTGWLQQLTTEGRVELSDVVYDGTASIEQLEGTYRASVPELDALRADGAIDITATGVDASGTPLDRVAVTARYADRQAEVNVDVARDNLQVGLGGTAQLADESQRLDLRRLDLAGEGLAWSLADATTASIVHADGLVTIDDLLLRDGVQQVRVAGAVRLPREAPADGAGEASPLRAESLAIDVEALDVAAVGAQLLPARELAGTLDVSLRMTGSIEEGEATARLQVRDAVVQGVDVEAIEASADYANGDAQVDVAIRQNAASSLSASGRVPVRALLADAPDATTDETLDVTVTSTGIDLVLLEGVTDQVTDVAGRLQIDGRVTGAVTAPQVDGRLVVQDGAFRVPLVDASFTGLDVDVRVAPDAVQVQTLRLLDGRGQALEVTGAIGLADGAARDVQLTARSDAFRLIDNDLGDVRLTTDLTVTGTPSAPVIRGEVTLPSSRVDVDRVLAVLAGRETAEERDDVDMVFEPGRVASAPAEATTPAESAGATTPAEPAAADPDAPGVLDAATIDVRLRIPGDLVVRGDDVRVGDGGMSLGALNVTVGADLRATQAPDESLIVTGAVTMVRGYYDFQGRRFTVVRDGGIRFEGEAVTNPTLDIGATREISGVEARIDVQGTAEEPELVLSSTPRLDEADILALIVFNRPLDDLGSGEQVSLARRAGELVGGRLTGALATSLRDALDVDQLEIDAFAATGPSVTVGNRIGERIYVRLRQQLGAQDLSQILLEYQLLDNLRLQTSMTQGGRTDRSPGHRVERNGIDLLYFFYY